MRKRGLKDKNPNAGFGLQAVRSGYWLCTPSGKVKVTEEPPCPKAPLSFPTYRGRPWTRRDSNPHLPTGQVDVLPLHHGPGWQSIGQDSGKQGCSSHCECDSQPTRYRQRFRMIPHARSRLVRVRFRLSPSFDFRRMRSKRIPLPRNPESSATNPTTTRVRPRKAPARTRGLI